MVPLLPWYYETLRPPDSLLAALRFLRLAIPRSDYISSPFGHSRGADGSSRSLLYRLLPIRSSSRNCQDLPSSRGTLLTIRPVLRPRRERIRGMGPGVNVSDMAPASNQDGGSPRIADFGAQSHGIWSGCLRLAVKGYPSPTQDSLPVAGPSFTGRDSHPLGSCERFLNLTILPPFPSYLAQGSFGRIERRLIAAAGSPQGLLPGAPTDPDVQVSRIRFVVS